MTGETVTVTIDRIAAGGDGVGRADGLVVFVPRTAPGDRVRVVLHRERRLARGRVIHVEQAGPDRVEPACPHYAADACGGCQLQHLSIDAQRRAKSGMIRDAFQRIARREVAEPEVRHAGAPWHYRAKLTLALRRGDGGWRAGLRRFDNPDAVFAMRECHITDERVLDAWRAVLAQGAFLPDAAELRGSVRLLDRGASLVVEGAVAWPEPQALLDAVPQLSAIWWTPEGGRRRLVATRGDAARHGASFTQVNPAVAALMRTHVLDVARAHAPQRVVDAYAGIGDTAEPLARDGARVVAIELDREAAQVAAARLPHGSRAVAAPVEQALPDALPADLVLLNPPRTGVDERVTRILENARPRTIIYVSCDPATLARDVGRLRSYQVRSLVAFDMFPQTAHVETVCELVLEAA
jgi:23S rRNA (uracil1939-C5)-methyltransferase